MVLLYLIYKIPYQLLMKYKLFESSFDDMSEMLMIYETNVINDTTFTIENSINLNETRYYQVIVEDVVGLESESPIEMGISTTRFFKII